MTHHFGSPTTKSSKKVLRVLICVLSIASVLVSCNRNRKIDPLVQLSPELAFVMTFADINLAMCSTWEELKANPENDKKLKAGLGRIVTSAETCAIIKNVVHNNEKIKEKALSTNTLPNGVFLFYAAEENEGGEFIPVGIGLFSKLENCRAAEEIFRATNIATWPCRTFVPNSYLSEIYK